MIHVCFCMNDKTGLYSKFVGTTMLSLFDNTTAAVTVHILHDNTLTDDNREKFNYLAGRYGQLVKFYNVEELCADRIEEINTLLPRAVKLRFTIGMYYRFFIPHVLPPDIERVIYLDGDLVVNLDIEKLWRIDLGDKIMGVVPTYFQKINLSPKEDMYEFNSGVLLMDMCALRAEDDNLKESIKIISEDTNYVGNDQEILNHCFQTRTLHLPIKFNRPVKWDRWQKITQIDNKIYHFNGAESIRSFGLNTKDPLNRLWLKYFLRTPWFNIDSIGRLYAEFQKIRSDAKNFALKVSAAVSDKKRAFFVAPDKIESMKKIFSIRDDEEIIPAEDESSLSKLLDAMKTFQGKYVFFITTKIFPKKSFPFKRLTEVGFVQNKDFLKSWELLSVANGEPFDTRPLVKVM